MADKELAINALGGRWSAGVLMALREQHSPFPDTENIAQHHHQVY